MNRKDRTRILTQSSLKELTMLSKEIERMFPIVVVEKPSHSLAMIKMKESAQNSLFFIGESLVSECQVECEGSLGLGIIQGVKQEESYCLAVIDAYYNAHPEDPLSLLVHLKKSEERILKTKINALKKLRETKVVFESIDQVEV